MAYNVAIDKAWQDILALKPEKNIISVKFFADEYEVNISDRIINSLSCNIAAKDFVGILILHYLYQKIKGLPEITGKWISFKELSGGESYYPAFRKRAIEPVLRKYSENPEGLFANLERVSGKKVSQADAAITIQAFEGVNVLVEIWASDEELKAEANILFDESINRIFCTEDVAVLAGFIAKYV